MLEYANYSLEKGQNQLSILGESFLSRVTFGLLIKSQIFPQYSQLDARPDVAY